ncbi:MAG: hypothetical protein SGI98_03915 [Verrucomicrobiota bacterium]|nr:hypothetical protein [Verrucomicrobiota bacterium]
MPAFVIGEDGQKYGPASELTIQQWVVEGRIVESTVLEDRATGEAKCAAEWDYLHEFFNPEAAAQAAVRITEEEKRYLLEHDKLEKKQKMREFYDSLKSLRLPTAFSKLKEALKK